MYLFVEKVVQMIRNKKKNVFVCRTKIDNDFKSSIEKKEKCSYRRLNSHIKVLYLDISNEKYRETFNALKCKYEKDRVENNAFLKDENVFYVSNESDYRELFEFNEFLEKLAESLPKFQANIVLGLVKTKSLSFLEKKKNIIQDEISSYVEAWISLNSNWSEYKKWLNVTLQEYARRLGLNELFKEVSDSAFEKLIESIESELPFRLEKIRNRNESNDFKASENVNTGFLIMFNFKFRNHGSRAILIRRSEAFLKESLNSIYKHACDILIDRLNLYLK